MKAKGKLVLLVEDNPDDAELTVRAFEAAGFQNDVAVAPDGLDALEYLFYAGRHAKRDVRLPDLVLLDLKLPRVDGFEVLHRIRSTEAMRSLPVIILTSSTERKDLIRGYDFGANGYLQKPVDFLECVEAMKHLASYWLLLNRVPS